MFNEKVHGNLVDFLYEGSPHFQRSVNIKYDLMSSEYVDFFVPTPQSVKALDEIACACLSRNYQRAHIFVGPYGVGKSIFGVALTAFLSRYEGLSQSVNGFLDRVGRSYGEISTHTLELFRQPKKFLPVVLSGDEGPLGLALTRALMQSLRKFKLDAYVNPPTMYQAVINKISQWETNYPADYAAFCDKLKGKHLIDVHTLKERIARLDLTAYRLFRDIYPIISAGAEFDPVYTQSPVDVLSEVAQAIKSFGYNGIFIIYDEFGRFLDGRIGKPKGREAQLLQDLAEFCNRTSDAIVHFIAITHKVMSQYAQGLNDDVRVEWQRIEGRFKTMSLTGDNAISYRLIEESLRPLNKIYSDAGINVDAIVAKALDLGLIDMSPEESLDLLANCIPLHPATMCCLPEISNKVAQNERTLYTFLFGRDDYSFSDILAGHSVGWPLVYTDDLYDYFSLGMKFDYGAGGVHEVWNSAEATLSLLDGNHQLTKRITKALAILLATKKGFTNRPTNDVLAYAVGYDASDVDFKNALNYLRDKRLIYFRSSTDCWEFMERSNVDVEAEVATVLGENHINPISLKRLLDRVIRPMYYTARKYNDEYGTVRYFSGIYFTIQDLREVVWDLYLRENDYLDGAVIYILPANKEELELATALMVEKAHKQVIFLMPESDIAIYEHLRELLGYELLKEKITKLKEQDPRVEIEVNFLFQDTIERIKKVLHRFIDPSAADGRWYYMGNEMSIRSKSDLSRIVSDICFEVFDRTPVIYNEALNRRYPSGQQTKAMQKVIDSVFQDFPPTAFGLTGSGPEMAIYKSVLRAHGLVSEYEGHVDINKPAEGSLLFVWEEIEKFFLKCRDEELSLSEIIDILQSPPYGIRKGALPLYFAVLLSRYMQKVSLQFQEKTINPITSRHVLDMVKYPGKFKVKFIDLTGDEKHFLDSLLLSVGRSDQRLWDLKQPLVRVSNSLIDWLSGLSSYAKVTEEFMSPEAIKFRKAIKESKNDPYRELLINIPAIVKKLGDAVESEAIQAFVAELSEADVKLLERLVIESRRVFGDENLEVNVSASTWWWNLTENALIDRRSYKSGDLYSNILMKYCVDSTRTEHDWVKALAVEYTGLSLVYWQDATTRKFLNMLSSARDRLSRELGKVESDSELITVTFGRTGAPAEQQSAITYRRTDLTPSGMNLLNTIKRAVETTGKYLNQDERMQLCVEMLKYFVNGVGTSVAIPADSDS